jgi:hypothetical protein
MPTHKESEGFLREWDRLSPEEQRRFRIAVRRFVADLKARRPPRAGLGIERYKSQEGVFEFHFSPDGRALFRYGSSPHPGEVHVIWLRIGTHDIYD